MKPSLRVLLPLLCCRAYTGSVMRCSWFLWASPLQMPFWIISTWRRRDGYLDMKNYWRGERRTLSWEQHLYLTSSPLTISLFSSYMHKYRSVIYVPLHTLVYIIHSAVYISVIAERGCNVQRLNVSRYSDSCPRTSPVQPGETNKLLHEQKAGQDFRGSPNYKWRACSWHVKLLSALCYTAQVPPPPGTISPIIQQYFCNGLVVWLNLYWHIMSKGHK